MEVSVVSTETVVQYDDDFILFWRKVGCSDSLSGVIKFCLTLYMSTTPHSSADVSVTYLPDYTRPLVTGNS